MLTPPPPRPRRGPLLAALTLVVVTTGVAVWALVSLLSANGDLDDAERAKAVADSRLAELEADDDLQFTRTRDEVLAAADHAIPIMNTLDHRTLDEDLAAWAEVTTGALHDEVSNVSEEQKDALRDAQANTTAKLLSSAVEELDDRAGTATVIAAIEKTQTDAEGEPQVTYQRVQATLARTEDDGWKLAEMGAVPYLEPGS